MTRRSALIALAALSLATAAHADYVVDQSNTVGTKAIAGRQVGHSITDIGQSFTAGLDAIDFAKFEIDSSAGGPLVLQLYEGQGTSGRVLALVFGGTAPTAGFQSVEFDFYQRVSLTIGGTYTLDISGLGAFEPNSFSFSYLLDSDANPYAGGEANDSDIALPDDDLVFSEGIIAASVPEPASLTLMGLGIAAAVRWRRR